MINKKYVNVFIQIRKNYHQIFKLDKMKKNSSLYNFKFVVIFQKVTFI